MSSEMYDADICSPGDLARRVRKIQAALAVAFENGAIDPVTANPAMDAARKPYALPALPDTIADAARAIDREALADIVFHTVLLVALVAVIVAVLAR